jgi:hypothetical protein
MERAHRHSPRSAAVAAAIAACVGIAACGGGSSRKPPSQADIATISRSVSDIVYQCQSVATGFIAAPDKATIERDVNSLVSANQRVQADATFVLGSQSALRRKTTLSKEIALAAHNLQLGKCSPSQAKRLQDQIDR